MSKPDFFSEWQKAYVMFNVCEKEIRIRPPGKINK